jgi:hypothetical protein
MGSPDAPVVESVDAVDSKSTIRKDVGVQVPPGAPFKLFCIQMQKKAAVKPPFSLIISITK